MDWLSTVWSESKQIAAEWVDYDNFQSELDQERAVQLAEIQTTATAQPVAPSGPGALAQVQPFLPWIAGGVLLFMFVPKFLK